MAAGLFPWRAVDDLTVACAHSENTKMQGGRKDGLARLLEFIAFLRSEGIYFSLESREPDAILVAIGVQGLRIEAQFTPDEMSFAYFSRDEQISEEGEKRDALLDRLGEAGRPCLPDER